MQWLPWPVARSSPVFMVRALEDTNQENGGIGERGEHERSHRDEEFGEDKTESAISSERQTGRPCGGS
jgi:hypothetical protein